MTYNTVCTVMYITENNANGLSVEYRCTCDLMSTCKSEISELYWGSLETKWTSASKYCNNVLQNGLVNDKWHPKIHKIKCFSSTAIHFFDDYEYSITVCLLTAFLIHLFATESSFIFPGMKIFGFCSMWHFVSSEYCSHFRSRLFRIWIVACQFRCINCP